VQYFMYSMYRLLKFFYFIGGLSILGGVFGLFSFQNFFFVSEVSQNAL